MFGKGIHEKQVMAVHLEMRMHQPLAVFGIVARDLLGAKGLLVEVDRGLGVVIDRHMRDEARVIRHGKLPE